MTRGSCTVLFAALFAALLLLASGCGGAAPTTPQTALERAAYRLLRTRGFRPVAIVGRQIDLFVVESRRGNRRHVSFASSAEGRQGYAEAPLPLMPSASVDVDVDRLGSSRTLRHVELSESTEATTRSTHYILRLGRTGLELVCFWPGNQEGQSRDEARARSSFSVVSRDPQTVLRVNIEEWNTERSGPYRRWTDRVVIGDTGECTRTRLEDTGGDGPARRMTEDI